MDDDAVRQLNREGWNRRAEEGDVWSVAVDRETIAKARKGDWQLVLTPTKPVPRDCWDDQVGGQLAAGLMLTGLYEDGWEESAASQLFPPFVATRAIKP